MLDNYVKYSPVNSDIIIRMRDISKKSTSVSIDNLCYEITNDDLKYIFERGYRGANSNYTGGNGIGLSVAKQIIENDKIDYNVVIYYEQNSKQHFKIDLTIYSLDKKGNK